MTLLDHLGGGAPPAVGVAAPRSADAATVVAVFVALQLLLPSKLVLNGLPLSLSAASIVALGLGALWLATQMTTTLGAAKGRNPVRTMLFAYATGLLVSYAYSSFGYLPPDERSSGDHAMVVVLAMVFVALAVCDGIRSRDRVYLLLRVIVICGAGVAVVGILQFLIGFDLTPHLRPPGMHFTSTDPPVLSRAGLRRVAGTTAHPIEFGVLCAMVLPLAVHIAFTTTQRGRRTAFWWACAGLVAAGLMFSVSRSAILAASSVAVVLFAGWTGQRRTWMAITGLAFLVFIKLISPGLLGTFFHLFADAGSDDSVKWRTHDYATARQLISQHLLLGRGLGTWYAPKHEIFDNQYLLTLVDGGLVGLVTFVGIFLAAIYAALRVRWLWRTAATRAAHADTDRDLALSLAASLAAVVITCATFDFAAFVTVSSLSFVLAGLCGALLRIVRADVASAAAGPHPVPPPRPLPMIG